MCGFNKMPISFLINHEASEESRTLSTGENVMVGTHTAVQCVRPTEETQCAHFVADAFNVTGKPIVLCPGYSVKSKDLATKITCEHADDASLPPPKNESEDDKLQELKKIALQLKTDYMSNPCKKNETFVKGEDGQYKCIFKP